MNETAFKERLKTHLGLNLELRVNENRHTMLSILKRTRSSVKLSLHEMFLTAPAPIVEAIAHYVRGTGHQKIKSNRLIRSYIHKEFAKLDYSHKLNHQTLVSNGLIHHLQPLYDEVNLRYFGGKLSLSLTWFGRRARKVKQRITFGQYDHAHRLIKIHRMLDQPKVPAFFISSILYHEMLHHILPSEVSQAGRLCLHGPKFKALEQKYPDYKRAQVWEKQNQGLFFR